MGVSKAVLMTGCSSGIGRATAERLAGVGWKVYATSRDVEAILALAAYGCELLPLDVTDEGSMRAAVEEVERREGAVGVLVNNAGYSQSGTVEAVSMEKVRWQFETNVFGMVRMCRHIRRTGTAHCDRQGRGLRPRQRRPATAMENGVEGMWCGREPGWNAAFVAGFRTGERFRPPL